MRLLIDDAHIELIEKAYEFYPVDGVTTNPTILSKVGGNPFDTLRKIRELIGDDDLHVQAVSRKAEDIVEEAKYIVNVLGHNTYVKIPAIAEGFKADVGSLDSNSLHSNGDLYTNAGLPCC